VLPDRPALAGFSWGRRRRAKALPHTPPSLTQRGHSGFLVAAHCHGPRRTCVKYDWLAASATRKKWP